MCISHVKNSPIQVLSDHTGLVAATVESAVWDPEASHAQCPDSGGGWKWGDEQCLLAGQVPGSGLLVFLYVSFNLQSNLRNEVSLCLFFRGSDLPKVTQQPWSSALNTQTAPMDLGNQ